MADNEKLNDQQLDEVSGGAYYGRTFNYVVVRGDCLSEIAYRFGTTVNVLVALNNIRNPDLIKVGQVLLIPAN